MKRLLMSLLFSLTFVSLAIQAESSIISVAKNAIVNSLQVGKANIAAYPRLYLAVLGSVMIYLSAHLMEDDKDVAISFLSSIDWSMLEKCESFEVDDALECFAMRNSDVCMEDMPKIYTENSAFESIMDDMPVINKSKKNFSTQIQPNKQPSLMPLKKVCAIVSCITGLSLVVYSMVLRSRDNCSY